MDLPALGTLPPRPATPSDDPLAEVERVGRVNLIRLPAELVEQTLRELARIMGVPGGLGLVAYAPDGRIQMSAGATPVLLQALEAAKPPRVDPRGCPLPWVPLLPLTAEIDGLARRDLDDDVQVVEELPVRGPELPVRDGLAWVFVEHERLRTLLGLPEVPLQVLPVAAQRRGFCAGLIFLHPDGTPLRVALHPCPNSDAAEILATLLHELVHALLPSAGHGPAFCRRLVGLAGELYGPAHFAHAPVTPPHGTVDRWVSTGIRAALAGHEPPAPKEAEEGKLLKVVSKIRKLHGLADGQVGTQEGITACGLANDLVTVYELGGYQVQIAAGLDEQMVDRWLLVPRGAVWRRDLAHGIARHFGVFSLHHAGKGRVHLFGRHADLVATIYLYEVCEAAIERGCRAHLARWGEEEVRGRGEAARERADFCGAAVQAFRDKLRSLADESPRAGGPALTEAQTFAAQEHGKRGQHWGTESGRGARANEAGATLGEALQIVRGVEGRKTRHIEGPK